MTHQPDKLHDIVDRLFWVSDLLKALSCVDSAHHAKAVGGLGAIADTLSSIADEVFQLAQESGD